jgi:hypothetical protein
MKTSKITYIILLFVFVMFFTAQSAIAGCAIRGGGSDPLDPNPQAKGTKYSGPLTIYYDDNGPGNSDDQICWFVRLRKGSTFYAFSECSDRTFDGNVLEPFTFPQDSIDLIKKYFFPEVAIPAIYDCTFGPDGDCPPAFLKSYDQDVGDSDPPFAAEELFFAMDITVAVED